MSNSSLISFTALNSHFNPRGNTKIDTITIHHMAGNMSVETCGKLFQNEKYEVSSNYGIGSDGRIALYCDESNRSWCSSSRTNDFRAITIEVANDGGAPNWHVSDKALESLIKLCVDICKRNGISKLVWSDSKDDRINHKNGCNMTVHSDFANKTCPGPYLMGKQKWIADQVNAQLTQTTPTQNTENKKPEPVPVANKPVTSEPRTIQNGCKGEDVKELQSNLNKVIDAKLAIDGSCGPLTVAAIKKFQTKYSLQVDGKFGPKSRAKMSEVLKSGTPAVSKSAFPYQAKIICSKGMNIRSGAGCNYSIIGSVRCGATVTVYAQSGSWGKISATQNKWVNVASIYATKI